MAMVMIANNCFNEWNAFKIIMEAVMIFQKGFSKNLPIVLY